MAKLLMITGDTALAEGRRGAFYNTLEEFHKCWEKIDIICPKAGAGDSVLFGNVFIHPSPWPKFLQPLWILKRGKELFKKERFGLFTVHEYPPFYNGIGAKLLHGKIKIPYVLEIMHIPGYPRSSGLKELFYKYLSLLLLKWDSSGAERVRVINKEQIPGFLRKVGVKPDKLMYTPAFYVDLEVFKPKPVEKKFDLIFVGRLAENKGIGLFIDAVKKSDLSAIVVGAGPEEKGLKRKIKKLGLENKIHFHGWAKDASEISDLMNTSRLLVMPSHNEGGPRVVLEAMACGVPVLASRVGIVQDLIKEQGVPVVIDWDSDEIARKAEEILSNKEFYEKQKRAGLKAACQFERISSIKFYADSLQKIRKNKNLLIITQKVDEGDDLLGFFTGWIDEFSKKYREVKVITLAKGNYSFQNNVSVFSLGKERKKSKAVRMFNFYKFLFRSVPVSDEIFVHMSPVFVIAAWPVAFLFRKKIIFWYLHRSVTFRLKIAERLCFRIVTAAKESLGIKSGKIIELGHGIDTSLFKTERDWQKTDYKLASVGRISQIKNFETAIRAVGLLKAQGLNLKLDIIGRSVMKDDFPYLKKIKELVSELHLEDSVKFLGFIPHNEIARFYKKADLFIGPLPTGGVDKAMLEAMASGCITFTSNQVFKKYFGALSDELVFEHGNFTELAGKIKSFLDLIPKDKNKISLDLTRFAEEHNLPGLIARIYSLTDKKPLDLQKILYFGTYDRNYSRTRVLLKGFEKNGVRVIECNDQSKSLLKYIKLVFKFFKIKDDYDAILVAFPGYQAMILAWFLSLVRFAPRKPIIFDSFFSLFNMAVEDRKKIEPRSAKGKYYWYLDYISCRLSDVILLDTNAHIRFFAEKFKLPQEKFVRVCVGTDDKIFLPARKKDDGPFVVHFHGNFIPLQGTEHIIEAAGILKDENIKFQIIGRGQDYQRIKELAKESGTTKINWIDHVSYESLPDYMARADVCLGVFGTTEKTNLVVPNKVYEAMACSKPVITADTTAIREFGINGENILLCKKGDAQDLAAKILELKNNNFLAEKISSNARKIFEDQFTPALIVEKFIGELKNFKNRC